MHRPAELQLQRWRQTWKLAGHLLWRPLQQHAVNARKLMRERVVWPVMLLIPGASRSKILLLRKQESVTVVLRCPAGLQA